MASKAMGLEMPSTPGGGPESGQAGKRRVTRRASASARRPDIMGRCGMGGVDGACTGGAANLFCRSTMYVRMLGWGVWQQSSIGTLKERERLRKCREVVQLDTYMHMTNGQASEAREAPAQQHWGVSSGWELPELQPSRFRGEN